MEHAHSFVLLFLQILGFLKMTLWLTVCGVLLFLAVSIAQPPLEWTPETYPNPRRDPAACGRPYVNASWVCDPNGLITVEEGEYSKLPDTICQLSV